MTAEAASAASEAPVAPLEEPAEAPVEEPADKPAEKPTEAPVEEPADASAKLVKPTLTLLDHPPVTYEEAVEMDENIIYEARHYTSTVALYKKLWSERRTIEALTKHHLGLGDQDKCTVASSRHWIRGYFNLCIPIKVQSANSCRKLFLRCPMPGRNAEAENPGNSDEKTGGEVGAYIWIQERCPDIRIPCLYGFGFSDHRHFTHEAHRPLYVRAMRYLQRLFYRLTGHPALLSRYTSHPTTNRLATAYLLLEDINSSTCQRLTESWVKHREDLDSPRRQNLYRGLAQVILSLARIPQPRIGSFRFHDNGTITLTNRPLDAAMMIFENEGMPRTMQRNDTFLCTDSYVTSRLNVYDKRFLNTPGMLGDAREFHDEMATRVLARTLAYNYIRRDQQNGPFFLQLSDIHSGNIFVDAQWNITCVIDLEWVCARPAEMLVVPMWLSSRQLAINEFDRPEYLAEFNKIWEDFMVIFAKEEEKYKAAAQHNLSLTQIIRETWESGGVWYWQAIKSKNAMYSLFKDHICPRFYPEGLLPTENRLLSKFWSEDAAKVVEGRIEAYRKYTEDMKDLFI